MLTEHFVAAISTSTKPNTGVTKDAGIFVHEYQPLAAQRHVFKKSAAAPNGIAVSSSHIFAAQSEKAIVHVYSRDKGNQEAIVPFPERIHSIALAAHDTVLLLGTESGRILAWEICSGRLVSTSNSHLQPVTSITVDSSTNFFLTGSSDAMIHVWALSSILSFSPETSRSPLQTLSTHRGPISSIVCGHSDSSDNIAVSISADKSAIVWNYQNGHLLRTYLLPEAPVTAALDPADRALFIGYGDGSLQILDFYDEIQKHATIDILRDQSQSQRPFQPSPKSRFHAESQKLGGVLSLSVSWDGTCLISGHASGKVALWDIAKSSYVSTAATLPGPVSNLQFLVPTGFPTTPEPRSRIQNVVKPKHDASSTGSGSSLVPTNYNLSMQFTSCLPPFRTSAMTRNASTKTAFEEALTHPSFPQSMLDESLIELESWTNTSNNKHASAADFVSLDGVHEHGVASNEAQQREIEDLKKQLASLQRVQKVTFSQLSEIRKEKEYYVGREELRSERARARAKSKANLPNGANNTQDEDMEMSDGRSD